MNKKVISLILITAILLSIFAPCAFAAGTYGNAVIYSGYSSTDYAVDKLLSKIQVNGKSKVEQIRTVYDWIIKNCSREEGGKPPLYVFSKQDDAAIESYSNNVFNQVEYGKAALRLDLASVFNTPGFADDMFGISFYAESMIENGSGNCMHFSSLLAVMLMHLGIDCHVIDGYFINADGSEVIHKWNYALIDGRYYWFDVRMDHANYTRTGRINYQYFMIEDTNRWERNHKWDKAFSNALASNAWRVPGMYNDYMYKCATAKTITVKSSRSGTADGSGRYVNGTDARLSASYGGTPFVGWYDEWGNKISTDYSINIPVTRDATYYALFENDVFADIAAGCWYLDTVLEANSRGLVNGTTPVTFDGDGKFTRAMVAAILSRISNIDTTAFSASPFTDVLQTSWYAQAVNWAYAKGIVNGRTETEFAPLDFVTRQEFMTMTVRYLNSVGFDKTSDQLNFTDSGDVSDYAIKSVGTAYSMGLVSGYPDGSFKPRGLLTRAEGTTIVLRAANYIITNETAKETNANG